MHFINLGSHDTERLSNLPRATELVSSWRIGTQGFLIPEYMVLATTNESLSYCNLHLFPAPAMRWLFKDCVYSWTRGGISYKWLDHSGVLASLSLRCRDACCRCGEEINVTCSPCCFPPSASLNCTLKSSLTPLPGSWMWAPTGLKGSCQLKSREQSR